MSEPSQPIQFDKAEYAATGAAPAMICANCAGGISRTYFDVNGQVVCEGCREALVAQAAQDSDAEYLPKALLFGLAGGVLGAVAWYLVERLANMRVGLIALLVGYLVGEGVARASKRRGGPVFQVAAVAITYLSIGLAYAPPYLDFHYKLGLASDAQLAWKTLLFALEQPYQIAFTSPISGIIIAFGLFQAWQGNQKRKLEVSGPFEVAQPGSAVARPG